MLSNLLMATGDRVSGFQMIKPQEMRLQNLCMSYFAVISTHNQGILTNIVDLCVVLPSRGRLKFASLFVGLM